MPLEFLSVYVKAPNVIYAQHTSMTRKQDGNKSMDAYILELNAVSKDCSFKAFMAEQYESEHMLVWGLNHLP